MRRVFKWSVEEVDLSGSLAVDAEWLSYLGSFRYLKVLKLADCKNVDNGAIWSLAGEMLKLSSVMMTPWFLVVTNFGHGKYL